MLRYYNAQSIIGTKQFLQYYAYVRSYFSMHTLSPLLKGVKHRTNFGICAVVQLGEANKGASVPSESSHLKNLCQNASD